jgi:peptide/nickel transport system permease protein
MKIFLQNLFLKKLALSGFVFLCVLLFLSVFIPFISPYEQDIYGAVHFETAGQPPSFSHWFGTDTAGRDMLTITIRAGFYSLKVAFGVVFFSVLIGVPIGMFAGVASKRIDEIIMRITDGFLAFPPLILPIAITAALGPSLNNVIIGISISWFPWYVRIARSQALIISSLDYVSISRSMGAGKLHVIKTHILPNSFSPILTQATIDAGYAILTAAGLSFIGLGAQHPDVEWGLLITQSRAQFINHWWEVFFPGIFILLTVASFNIIGDELRNITNEKRLNSG